MTADVTADSLVYLRDAKVGVNDVVTWRVKIDRQLCHQNRLSAEL